MYAHLLKRDKLILEIFEIIKFYCYKFNSQKKLRINNKKDKSNLKTVFN